MILLFRPISQIPSAMDKCAPVPPTTPRSTVWQRRWRPSHADRRRVLFGNHKFGYFSDYTYSNLQYQPVARIGTAPSCCSRFVSRLATKLNLAYPESPSPSTPKRRLLSESAGRLLRNRNRQKESILSGSLPWPCVEQTNTTSLSSTSRWTSYASSG